MIYRKNMKKITTYPIIPPNPHVFRIVMKSGAEVKRNEGHCCLLTHQRALLNFSYVFLSFFFLCPHIFARASDLTTQKMPSPLSSHFRMSLFSSGERSISLTNSHKWEFCKSSGTQEEDTYLVDVFLCMPKYWGSEKADPVNGIPAHGRGWNRAISKVPSNPNQSMILWF